MLQAEVIGEQQAAVAEERAMQARRVALHETQVCVCVSVCYLIRYLIRYDAGQARRLA